jgi:phospholipid-binding lipoprotein MlaA
MRIFFLVIAALALSGCTTRPETGAPATLADPFETVNRGIFQFNDDLDRAVIRPVAVAYRDAVPLPVRQGAGNALRNLTEPWSFGNRVLQGDAPNAYRTFWRFVFNSTVGLGGLIDVAAREDTALAYNPADLGQTLGIWGVPPGPYLVLPILGPSTVRDGSGLLARALADPIGLYQTNNGYWWAGYVEYAWLNLDTRVALIEAVDELKRSSFDYYATVRNLYGQTRRADILGGEATVDIPDFEETP